MENEHYYKYKAPKPSITLYIKNIVKNTLKKIHKFGSESFTIMIMPGVKKKSLNLHISNYIIFFFILIPISIGIIAFTTNPENNDLDKTLKHARIEDKKVRKLYTEYKETIKRFEEEVALYNKSLNKIFNVVGSELPDTISANKIKPLRLLSRYEYPDEALTATSLFEKLEESRAHLENISRLIEMREDLIDAIPSRWPIQGNVGQCTSLFGPRISPFTGKKAFHTGVDIAHRTGTPIVASADGRVIYSGYRGGYGYTVVVKHKFGYKSFYAHNYRLTVGYGQHVRKGQVVAKMGQSGRATGPHLHYEVRLGNTRVDPWPYLTTRF